MAAEFKVIDFSYKIENDDGSLSIFEAMYPIKVRYQGPYFYLDASVQCTIPAGETWSVGFVQTCDAIELRHSYQGGNYTRWEFPTPISDSTTSSFPYYSKGNPNVSGRRTQNGKGLVQLVGPQTKQAALLSMNDNLASNVQWWDPVPPNQENYDASFPHTLTAISRKQKFSTYLVAHKGDLSTAGGYRILGQVVWRSHFSIAFDCSKPAGQRATAKFEEGHSILHNTQDGTGLKLPAKAFVNENANAKQKLVGYGGNGVKLKPQINW